MSAIQTHTYLSVVVPVYNSSASLEELCQRLSACLEGKYPYEMILVNDASRDDSWQKIKLLKAHYGDNLRGINLSQNAGQHQSLLCGFGFAKGEFILTIDDDLQHAPEDIPQLLKQQQKSGADLVYGMYSDGKKHSLLRNAGSKLIGKFFQMHASTSGYGSPFRLIRRSILDTLLKRSHPHVFLDVVLQWYAPVISSVEVKHESRKTGKSNYSFFRLVRLSIDYAIGYTAFPLRMMTYLGLLSSLVCIILVAFYIWKKYTFGAELGFTALITAIFLSTGIILFSLGIIGEYIRRIFLHLNHKPQVLIKESL